jgi:hypothetical protein
MLLLVLERNYDHGMEIISMKISQPVKAGGHSFLIELTFSRK